MTDKKVTTREFVNELHKAPEWAVEPMSGANFLKLHVRENGEITTYVSPDMLDLGETEAKVFLAEVRRICRIREKEEPGSRLF